jgi:hypothetical protein
LQMTLQRQEATCDVLERDVKNRVQPHLARQQQSP